MAYVDRANDLKWLMWIGNGRTQERCFKGTLLTFVRTRRGIPSGRYNGLPVFDTRIFDHAPVAESASWGFAEADAAAFFGPRLWIPEFHIGGHFVTEFDIGR